MLFLLRNRNFFLLWIGQAISQLGNAIFNVALLWLVLELTGSALAMGTVLIFTQVPWLVLQLLGGVLVDRYNRQQIMILSDVLRSAIVFLFAVFILTDWIELWHIYALATCFGIVAAFFNPAQAALLPLLVSKESLVAANALSISTLQLSNIIGPAIGGFIVALAGIGIGGASLLNAVSFGVGALALWLLRIPSSSSNARHQSLWTDLKEGWHYLWWTKRVLGLMLALAGLINFASASLLVLWPILSKEIYGTGAWGYGLLSAAFAVGVLAGSIITGAIGRVRRPGLFIYGLAIFLGLGFSLGAFMSTLPVAMGLYAILGGVIGMVNVVFTALIQEFTAEELRGRIFSWVTLVSAGLVPLSMGVAGAAVDMWGPLPWLFVGGLWITLVSLLSLLLPEVRRLE